MTNFFASRADAARRLARALVRYRGRNPLVLAIPRGAVEMGRVVADKLDGELDVVLVRKLRSDARLVSVKPSLLVLES
jgi:putative phosphoribosyl transferase